MPSKTWRQGDAMASAAAVFPPRFSPRGGSRRDRVEIEDARAVSARRDKAQQIGGRDRGGAGVVERMVIERVVVEHRPLKHHPYPLGGVVDERKRRDAARPHTEHRVEQLGGPERKAWCAERRGEKLEVDLPLLECDDEPQPAFFVLEEEALAMAARELAA